MKKALVVDNVVVDVLVVESPQETLLEKQDLEKEALVKRRSSMVGRTLLRWNLEEIGGKGISDWNCWVGFQF